MAHRVLLAGIVLRAVAIVADVLRDAVDGVVRVDAAALAAAAADAAAPAVVEAGGGSKKLFPMQARRPRGNARPFCFCSTCG